MNIYQRLSAITEELNSVAKNLKVGEGKSSYKATGEADVLAAVKPLEAKHGVYSYPVDREIVESEWQEVSKTYKGETTVSRRFFMRLKVTYRFINAEEPTEYIDIISYGDGIDSGDKAPGKAMTYADKYALLKAYKIITGDDPDQTHSDELFKGNSAKAESGETKLSPNQLKIIQGYPAKTIAWVKQRYMVEDLAELKKEDATAVIKAMNAKKKEQEDAMIAEEARQAFEGV